jgi:predicted nucleic acid-binding protein
VKLLDTTVAIDYLRRRDEAMEAVDGVVREREWLGASEVVRFELLAGARPREEERIERFFVELGWIRVDEAISRRAGELARRFRATHGGIEDADYLIAATALELEADLLTTNVRHFPMLPGLQAAY